MKLSLLIVLFSIHQLGVLAAFPSCPYAQSSVYQSKGQDYLTSNGRTITLPGFTLFNNVWGVLDGYANLTETIFTCSNGAGYGWSWNRGVSSRRWFPNYPETAYGLSPYYVGGPSTTTNLPVKLSKIQSIVANMNISHGVNDNNGANMWDFSYDIWWASVNPATTDASKNITNEIMIWFMWNSENVVTAVQANAVNDGFGNTYDYAEAYQTGSNTWYHQFRITGTQRIPSKVNLKPFFDYVQRRYNNPDDYLCSIELGTENWDNTTGAAIIHNLRYDFTFTTSTPAPTTKPTNKPSALPTNRPTSPSTNRPTPPSTSKPTPLPSNKPSPPPTNKPATSPPTNKPATFAPTRSATQPPTQKATLAPTRPATQAPTPTVTISPLVTLAESTQPGTPTDITFSVTSSTAFYGIIQVCILPALDYTNQQRVVQYVSNYNLPAGTTSFTFTLTIPAATAAGAYKATIGVYSSTWIGYAWRDPAATIYVCVPSTTITTHSASPTTVARGGSTVATYTIRSACPASAVNVMASVNPLDQDDSRRIAGNSTVVSLNAGDAVVSLKIAIPNNAATGSYRITMGCWTMVTWTNLAYEWAGAYITVV